MRRVLITGGTRGIGRALVEAFLRNGDAVAFTYKDSVLSAEQLRAQGAAPFRFDLSEIEKLEGFCAEIARQFGAPDVLICNAGVASLSLFTDLSFSEWERVRSVDFDAPLLTSRFFLPDMIRNKFGKILYISSMWGQVGASCEVAYSAAKSGLLGLTKALAKEVGPSGINVNCVCPGIIDTEMNASLDEETRRALKDETPLLRFGTPGEVARLCLYLCSEDASFITGQVVGINGGFVIT